MKVLIETSVTTKVIARITQANPPSTPGVTRLNWHFEFKISLFEQFNSFIFNELQALQKRIFKKRGTNSRL